MKKFISNHKVFIIAEAGVNHNGRLALAKRLVDAAKRAGADAVKFQTFQAESLTTASAAKAGYQKRSVSDIETQRKMLKRLELDRAAHLALRKHCRKQGIMFMSTAFDEKSADLLAEMGMGIFKIPSGEITNLPFLKYVARKKKPLILSTGMATLVEVKEAVRTIFSTGNRNLTLLHCVTEYPAPVDVLNLKALLTLKKEFRLPVGLSDHSLGTLAAPIAVGLGAQVIEKHLTLDRRLPGPDHKASLEPKEFQEMVRNIRSTEQMLGDGRKKPSHNERKYIPLVRKSIVSARDIEKGQKITPADLVVKRPGTGIPPGDLRKVVGRKARRPIAADRLLEWRDLK